MSDLEALLKAALSNVNANIGIEELANPTAETSVFDALDSFAVVELLLETESALEEKFSRYIPLGDETVFDAQKSPLLRWADWITFVERRCGA